MNFHPPASASEAAGRIATAWGLVGASHLTLLEVVQIPAAVAGTVYALLQTFFLLRDRLARKDRP